MLEKTFMYYGHIIHTNNDIIGFFCQLLVTTTIKVAKMIVKDKYY